MFELCASAGGARRNPLLGPLDTAQEVNHVIRSRSHGIACYRYRGLLLRVEVLNPLGLEESIYGIIFVVAFVAHAPVVLTFVLTVKQCVITAWATKALPPR
jgi:hypothetical protein